MGIWMNADRADAFVGYKLLSEAARLEGNSKVCGSPESREEARLLAEAWRRAYFAFSVDAQRWEELMGELNPKLQVDGRPVPYPHPVRPL